MLNLVLKAQALWWMKPACRAYTTTCRHKEGIQVFRQCRGQANFVETKHPHSVVRYISELLRGQYSIYNCSFLQLKVEPGRIGSESEQVKSEGQREVDMLTVPHIAAYQHARHTPHSSHFTAAAALCKVVL